MKKTILAIMWVFLAGCVSQQASVEPASSPLEGIWAMVPLANGIANVVQYHANGKAHLHSFNCAKASDSPVEISDYTLSADQKTIHIQAPTRSFDLDVLGVGEKYMMLAMMLDDYQLKLLYRKVNKIEPICELYKMYLIKPEATPGEELSM